MNKLKLLLLGVLQGMCLSMLLAGSLGFIKALQAEEFTQVAGAATQATVLGQGDFVDKINSIRTSRHLQPIAIDKTLMTVADTRAKNMHELGYYAHKSPETNEGFESSLTLTPSYACENLNLSYSPDPNGSIDAWLTSDDGHRECLLNKDVVRAGYSSTKLMSVDTEAGRQTSYITVLILASDN